MVAGVFYSDLFFALGLFSVLVEGGTFIHVLADCDLRRICVPSEKLIAGLCRCLCPCIVEGVVFPERGLKVSFAALFTSAIVFGVFSCYLLWCPCRCDFAG